MSAGVSSDWIVDTGILVHVMRADALGRFMVEEQQLRARQQAPLVSVVTVGELLSLSRQFGWGEEKVAYMREILAELVVVDINSEPVLDAYAEIDAWCVQNGLVLGKNDLWIAATASVTEAEVITVDKDFDPLNGKFLSRRYYDPAGSYPSAPSA